MWGIGGMEWVCDVVGGGNGHGRGCCEEGAITAPVEYPERAEYEPALRDPREEVLRERLLRRSSWNDSANNRRRI